MQQAAVGCSCRDTNAVVCRGGQAKWFSFGSVRSVAGAFFVCAGCGKLTVHVGERLQKLRWKNVKQINQAKSSEHEKAGTIGQMPALGTRTHCAVNIHARPKPLFMIQTDETYIFEIKIDRFFSSPAFYKIFRQISLSLSHLQYNFAFSTNMPMNWSIAFSCKANSFLDGK